MKGRSPGMAVALALAALGSACGPSQPPVYAEDVVLPAPGGAALAGIPPADAVAVAAIATRVPDATDASRAPGEPREAADPEAPTAPDADEVPDEPAPPLPPRVVTGPGFRYAVPADWEELDPTTLGSPMLVLAQRAAAPTDGFMTNVNVAVEPWEGDDDAYGAANVAALGTICLLEGDRPARVGNRAALDVEAYWQNQGGVPYRTLQRYVAGEGAGLVITCAAAATAFDDELALCEAVVESFRLE